MVKTVIVGASSGLGRALAEELSARGHALFLVSRQDSDLAPLAAELERRGGRPAGYLAFDIARDDPESLRRAALDHLGGLESLIMMAGETRYTSDNGPLSQDDLSQLAAINFTGTLAVINAFLPDLMAAPNANLVGAGSIAGWRGRRRNIVYGACKRGLEFYFHSLRHLLVGTGCKIQFYRLGYIRTRMTLSVGFKPPLPMAEPEDLARHIANNLGRDLGTVTLPRWWVPLLWTLRLLPWPIFKRLDL